MSSPIPEFAALRAADERARQLAGLYEAEKRRADKLSDALAEVVRQLSSKTGGSIADLVSAINNAEKILIETKG